MFCFVYKWMISWSLDSGKELPGSVNRHIVGCTSCREFARTSAELAARLTRDAPGFLQRSHDTLDSKITSALDGKPGHRLTPKRRFHFSPVPVLTAALVVLLVTIAIIFQVIPITSPAPGESSIAEPPGTAIAKNPLPILKKIESPIESEMNKLGKSINSAAKFLVSRLDIKISPHGMGNL